MHTYEGAGEYAEITVPSLTPSSLLANTKESTAAITAMDTSKQILVVPKFAEFLGNTSSAGLRILSSSTCVGLRYGHALHNSSFSRHMAHTLCYFISLHITSSDYTTDLPIVHLPRLYRSFHSRPVLSTCVPTVLIMRGTGI